MIDRNISHSPMLLARALAVSGVLLATPGVVYGAETARFINAPATASAPAAKLAVQYELKVRLPLGRGLARALLDAGVDRDDAAAAARLAAGHLGDGTGGCDATISVSKATAASAFKVVRVSLTTDAEQTVIERRGTDLTIASLSAARKAPRIV